MLKTPARELEMSARMLKTRIHELKSLAHMLKTSARGLEMSAYMLKTRIREVK
jgi:hypothetical protein